MYILIYIYYDLHIVHIPNYMDTYVYVYVCMYIYIYI